MNIVAGIFGLFVGVYGFVASFFIISFGIGLGKIWSDGGSFVLIIGWFHLIYSLSCIILSVFCFTNKNIIVSAILLILSTLSIIFGVAIPFLIW